MPFEEKDIIELEQNIDKQLILLEIVQIEHNQMYKDAELKVLKESGTSTDLVYLYTEADAEAAQKQNGIIDTIANALKKLWSGIVGAINSLFGTLPANAQATVDENEYTILQTGKNVVEQAMNKNFEGAWAELTKNQKLVNALKVVAGGAAATGVAVGATHVINSQTDGALAKWYSDKIGSKITTATDWVKTALDKALQTETGQKIANAVSAATGFTKEKFNDVKNFVNTALKIAKDWIFKLAGKVKDAATNAKNKLTGNNQQQQQPVQQPQAQPQQQAQPANNGGFKAIGYDYSDFGESADQ